MKNRKALSSVVGTVFSIIALVTVVTYVTFSMNTLEQFNQEVMVKNTEIIDQAKEEFDIVRAETVNNKFNITIQNTGSLPINVTRLWIQNKTDPNWGTYKYDINTVVSPGTVAKNIGQNIPLYAKSTQGYEIKLTTERGNDEEFLINSLSAQPLYIQLYAVPPIITTDFTSTILMTVVNNMSNNNMLLDLRPTMTQAAFTTCAASSCVLTLLSGPTPTSYETLASGDLAVFKWVYQLSNASPDDQATFTAQLTNGYPGQSVSVVVTVEEIVSALQAGTSLSSLGLTTQSGSNSTLIMHLETFNTPSARYQLHPPMPEGEPNPIQNFEDGNPIKLFTKNDTQTRTIPAGTWNASLRYSSAVLPDGVDSLTTEGHIFHFNANPDGTALPTNYPLDSISDQDCWEEEDDASNQPGSAARPTWLSTGGVHGSGAYDFDGGDWLSVGRDSDADSYCVEPRSTDDTTAGWFKADDKDGYHSKQVIWDIGYGSDDFYEIYIGDGNSENHGKLFFRFDTGGSTNPVTCSYVQAGADGYMDGQWHHFVAVRDGANSCRLYVDGVQRHTSNPGGSDTSIDSSGDLFIGAEATNGNPTSGFFYGVLDDLMHWNNQDLESSDVTALYNANYGTAAHKVQFVLDKTNKDGVLLSNIFIVNSYDLPFMDRRHWSSDTDSNPDRDSYWKGANFTKSGMSQLVLNPGERLNFTMSFVSGSDVDIMLDDINLDGISDPLTSYLQIPTPDSVFPSYFQYDNCGDLIYWTYNAGPYGSWFVYQGTRVIMNDVSSTKAFAGIPRYTNSTTMDEDNDSIFIPVGSKAEIQFYPPQNPPQRDTSPGIVAVVPPGDYNMYVFIDGYDERGQTFLRNVDIGVVEVYQSSSGCHDGES